MPVHVVATKALPTLAALVVHDVTLVGGGVVVAQVVLVNALPASAADDAQAATGVGPVAIVWQVVAAPATQVPVATGVQTPPVHDLSCVVLRLTCVVVMSRGVSYSTATPLATSILPMAPLKPTPPTGSQNQRLPSGPAASGPVAKLGNVAAPVTG